MLFTIFFFFFNDTATTEIYTLSLHDALPIYFSDGAAGGRAGNRPGHHRAPALRDAGVTIAENGGHRQARRRSEEHTSELQSQSNLVCRLLLEKKKLTTHLRNIGRIHCALADR